jgi:hypothetical protein
VDHRCPEAALEQSTNFMCRTFSVVSLGCMKIGCAIVTTELDPRDFKRKFTY